MTSVTCRLTAKYRDQLRNPTLGNQVWATFFLLLLHPLNDLFSRTAWVRQYRKGKSSLDLNEARDVGVLGCSGISWTICKQSAPRSRLISTLHHSVFTDRMLFMMPNQQCPNKLQIICIKNNLNRPTFLSYFGYERQNTKHIFWKVMKILITFNEIHFENH